MDGTHRSGGRVIFVLQEGIDNMVINADLIPSEAEEHVDPVLLDFKNSYGSPLIVVRDMAKGIKLSVEKNFPNASQQVCQVHFLSDLEKDLITEYHKKLKNSIVKHNLDCAPSSRQVVKVVYLKLSPFQNRPAICTRSMNEDVLNCKPPR